ncbi:hypothetical protein ACJ73_06313, partial [Blastomyces percursus]
MAGPGRTVDLTENQGATESPWRSDWDMMTISRENLGGGTPISKKEFFDALKKDKDRVYQEIAGLMDNARENLCRIRSERNAYRTQAERVGQLDKQVDDLMEERDNLQQAVNNLALQRGTPAGWNLDTRRSVKIDDPKHLTDGKEPFFEHWLSRMKNKFVVNADHFPTEESKIAYIENRTDGAAARHLAPRMREGHPEKFTTAEE